MNRDRDYSRELAEQGGRVLVPQAAASSATVDTGANGALPSSTGGTADRATGGAGLAAGPGAGAVPPSPEPVDLERLRVVATREDGDHVYQAELEALLAVVDAARAVALWVDYAAEYADRDFATLSAALEPFTPTQDVEPCACERAAVLEGERRIAALKEELAQAKRERRAFEVKWLRSYTDDHVRGLQARLAQAEREAREAQTELRKREGFFEARLARVPTLVEALRDNVGDAYNLITQGELPTQRRQPSARRIYDRSRAAVAAWDAE